MLSRIASRLTRNEVTHRLVAWALARYISLVFRTTRWTYEGFDEGEQHLLAGRRIMAVIWHNRVTIAPFAWRMSDRELIALISDHRDGRLLTDVLTAAGVGHIRVPANALSQRGPVEESRVKLGTTRAIQSAMRAGSTIGIVGDGPTGPRLKLKPAVLSLARVTDADLTVVTASVKRRIVARSWDRLIIPLPFNRGVLKWGGRFYDPRIRDREALEDLRREIEADMVALTDEVDRKMGHDPIT